MTGWIDRLFGLAWLVQRGKDKMQSRKERNAMQPMTQHDLHRSTTNKMITGVCGGIAETFGIDANIIRLVVLVLTIPFSVLMLFFYLALALILPDEER
jgi:phage shock protein C